MRPGLGLDGLAHLKNFVDQGGLLITCQDTAQFAVDNGLAIGVSVAPAGDARVVGSVLNTVFVAPNSPVAFGYGASVPVISDSGLAFNISNTINRASGRVLMDPYSERPTGRGTVDDSDEKPRTKKPSKPNRSSSSSPGKGSHSTRNSPATTHASSHRNIAPTSSFASPTRRPCCSPGLLDKPSSDRRTRSSPSDDAHLGKGNVLLFGNNPIYRGETIGNYALVFSTRSSTTSTSRMNQHHAKDTLKRKSTAPVVSPGALPGRRFSPEKTPPG